MAARLAMRMLAVFAALAAAGAWAQGTGFGHKDWDVVCDNTLTCRAAGYHAVDEDAAVSVLLTRAAGPRQPVTGEVALGNYDAQHPLPATVGLTLAGKPAGSIALDKETATGRLAPAQVEALLEALRGSGEIAFVAGPARWRLSSAGATAVLLRMDEVQGRVGTTGALVRKGGAGEESVKAAVPRPVVRAAAVPAGPQPPVSLAVAVLRSLGKAPRDCEDLAEPTEPPKVWRLAPGKVLVSQRCWMAAYNVGYGFWVANDKPPYRPRLVTAGGAEFDPQRSRLVAMQKGRGLGDCYEIGAWVWDGQRFVRTEELSTGQCRLVAAGGPWEQPRLVTEVIGPAAKRTTEEKRK